VDVDGAELALADLDRLSLAELLDPTRRLPDALVATLHRLVEQAEDGQIFRFQSAP
jgi:hypothetical protein